MTSVTGDTRRSPTTGTGGAVFAVVSAASFGLSGALARGLLDTGWTPGAVVLVRIALAALVLAPAAAWSLRGRWGALRHSWRTVVLYGLLAVAGAQFCYFSAVATMDVGPALLIEYTAPVAVVAWTWLRTGSRPAPATLAGAALAAGGLVLVLDLFSGADLALSGVAWASGAMVGATAYFLISADTGTGLPPLALAGGGLAVGATALGALALAGLLPVRFATASVPYAPGSVAWWVPLLPLGLVTAALAYATGVAAGRRLGSRVASFLALLEVLAAVVFAALLLDQRPGAVQLAGGALVLAGVVVVKTAEGRTPSTPPAPRIDDEFPHPRRSQRDVVAQETEEQR
ncbi:EamA family transporter [Kineococcus arenarius]|uniref:EamA family transporter n=1 Tax=unclassified Kineococcus TaxID=2621656 RepID=UPI003D7E9945